MNLEMIEKNIEKPHFSISVMIDPFNKRVRIDEYLGHFPSCIQEALEMVKEISAEKLIFKARQEHILSLIEAGFIYEAKIDQYYLGSDCFFLVKYFTNDRRNSQHWVQEDHILTNVLALEKEVKLQQLPVGYKLRKANKSDAVMLADLYRTVFKVYPTPMNDPSYINKCMNHNTIFYICTFEEKIISAASAEVNSFYHNAEMTDCATLTEHRQFGLMKHILIRLEEELLANKIYCVYSIARALSFGMNSALHQLKYQYRGRLANNCYIYNQIEDMNMWVKQLV